MPTYEVTSQTTGPVEIKSVQADSPEQAIDMTVQAAKEGESVEVMKVVETAPDAPSPSRAKEGPHSAPAPAPAKK